MDPTGADDRRAVVITGVGSVSPLGIGGGAFVARAVARGHSAIGPVRAFPTEGSIGHLGGEVGDLSAHLTADEGRRLPRVSQLTVVAARLAAADAGLELGPVAGGSGPGPGLGLVLGSYWGDFRSSEAFARGFLARGPLGLSPLIFPSTVMNAMAAHAAIAVGAQGPMLTLNQMGIAGELAVTRAATLIAAGRAEVVLAGGVDELCGILYRELGRLGVTSRCEPGPEGCWPFDRRANGTVLGEGATLLVLEAEAAARARGARIHARLRGLAWGNLPAPAHGVPPRSRREPAVIRRALAAAGVGPDDVDAAYLTGAAHPELDACELDLIERAFQRTGRRPLPVTALTPLTGDHAGLGGLRAASAAVLTLGDGGLPALPDLRGPIPAGLAAVTPHSSGPRGARTVLVHGLARGGAHVALVLGRAA